MLVQLLVVTSVRPHPASSSAQRACQLHPTAGQACRCCGSVQPALVRLPRAALCIVLERLILTLGANVYGAGLRARQLHPAPPSTSAG